MTMTSTLTQKAHPIILCWRGDSHSLSISKKVAMHTPPLIPSIIPYTKYSPNKKIESKKITMAMSTPMIQCFAENNVFNTGSSPIIHNISKKRI